MKGSKLGKSILVYVMCAFVIFGLVFSALLFFNTKNTVNDALGSQGINVASNIAAQIDKEKFKKFKENPTQSPTYWEIREDLYKLKVNNGVLYVYTYDVPQKGQDVTYLIDGAPKDTKEIVSQIGDKSFTTKYEHVQEAIQQSGYHSSIIDDPTFGQYLTALAPLKDDQGNVIAIVGVDIAASAVEQIQKDILITSLPIAIGIMIVIGLMVVFFIYSFIKRSLQNLTYLQQASTAFADGNIKEAEQHLEQVSFKYDNEITDFSKSFLESLKKLKMTLHTVLASSDQLKGIVGTLGNTMDTVQQSNNSIADSILQIAAGGEQQKVNNSEVLSAMEEMTIGIQRIADSTTNVAESSNEMTMLVESSVAESIDVVTQVQQIEASVLATGEHVKEMGVQFRQIEEMVEVITGIADQTNLLALNAAIEAARAGDSGKGFAVVAGEVRKLAEMSRSSAEEIREHLQVFEQVTEKALGEMETSTAQVRTGNHAVSNIGQKLEQVLQAVTRVNQEIQEVSAVVEEMSASSEEVLASTEQMSSIVNGNAERASQVAAASDQQVEMVDDLNKATANLQTSSNDMVKAVQQFTL